MCGLSSNRKSAAGLASVGGRRRELGGDRRLARSRGAHDERAAAAFDATAQKRIQRVQSARQPASRGRAAAVGGDDALEYFEASASNQKIVIPAAKADAAILDDANAPPLGAVFRIAQVEQDHAMRNALYLQVVVRLRSIVEHEDRAVASGKELLEREDLPTIAKRIAGKQPQLREGIEYDPRRLDRVHFGQDRSRGVAQFHLGRVKDRIGLVGLKIAFRWNDFTDLHACEVPAVRRSHRSQLVLGFGERDVEDRFPIPGAFAQKLQRERGLAGARHALDEVQPVGRQPAAQYEVETVDPGTLDRRPVSRFVHLEGCSPDVPCLPHLEPGFKNGRLPEPLGASTWGRTPAR